MSDELFDGRKVRLLTIVDNHTRESLAIHVGQRIRGCDVVEVLERVVKDHGSIIKDRRSVAPSAGDG